MRKEIRNIVIVLVLIGLVGAFAIVSPSVSESSVAAVRPTGGVLQAILWLSIATFLVVQSVLTVRTLQLLRRPHAEAVAGGRSSNHVLDVIWTVLPLVLAIAVGIYSYFWL